MELLKTLARLNGAAVRHAHLSSGFVVQDESGQFCYNQNTQIHWVSFLDGRQRVLLFTEDVAIVTKARQAEEMEQFEKEINVSLQNLGLSLINNETKQEISYIGITRYKSNTIIIIIQMPLLFLYNSSPLPHITT